MVMTSTIETGDCSLTYRNTPWDAKAFGFPTREILMIEHNGNADAIKALLNEYDHRNRSDGIQFTYTRANSNDKQLKAMLQQNQFYFAEASYFIRKTDIGSFDSQKLVPRTIDLEVPTKKDLPQLRDLAENSFDYSRFHEDPYLPERFARVRYKNWIDNIMDTNNHLLVHRKKEEIIAFSASNIHDDGVTMTLVGTKKGSSTIALFFWRSIFEDFKKREIKSCCTTISASNLGIMKLYTFFQFRFEALFLGFHKKYPPESE